LLEDAILWIDGKFTPFAKARVHILSHSFGRGSAIFEAISCYDTELGVAVFRLKDHLARLGHSAQELMMKLPYPASGLLKAVHAAVRKNQVRNGLIKIIAFYPGVGLEVIPTDTRVSVAITALQFGRDVIISKFGEDKFATAGISKWRKPHPSTMPVHAKASGNYLNPMLAKLEIRKRGFKTPILLDTEGFVAEGATESIFIVKRGMILTSKPKNILPSITRMSVLEIAKDLKIPLQEKKLLPKDLFACDEAFFSSTTCKVWPISRIENRKIKPLGPVSMKLQNYFDQILKGRIKKYHKWLSVV